MTRLLATIGALFGLGAVILGAFGAHALEGRVTPERAEVWTTAAHYLGWQGTALLALAALTWSANTPAAALRLLGIAGWLLVIGTLIFSGSLFVLVLSGIGVFGAITPIGGLLLVAGWGVAAAAALQLTPGN
ncbi:DUF423 domain-containing protein [Lamprobacter modestohalophilus]|uniref:DUF423 domain-containing protein n=1 Tax=Lamprobacter modestohalophilus TaxID=1064514 RepID=A0A9X0W761_9GAMM|nr:DUF423 domain-containing protein [Lamprobacter modestohalophilus]MBK1618233.1 hypothetical protein [Lamprobacter modestohalophilus]MEA1051435.1 DUF423 domain-containing protein [Lamprobacter modestohalophilus]